MSLNEAAPNSVAAAAKAPTEVPNDGTGVINLDPWLEPFRGELKSRFAKAQDWIKKLDQYEGGLDGFSKVRNSSNWLPPDPLRMLTAQQGYEKFGLNVQSNGDITYREWAPNAVEAHLVGDFSPFRPTVEGSSIC
jgi:1,4-alpha-glucan branching enzyme